MENSTKIIVKDLSLYTDMYEDTDQLVVVFNCKLSGANLISSLYDLFKDTDFEIIEWEHAEYEVSYLKNVFDTAYRVFSLSSIKDNIIFSKPDAQGRRYIIKDNRKPQKIYTLNDF